jgi:hypothetical protein
MKQLFWLALALALAASKANAAEAPQRPQVTGDWWQIAGDPDLRELTSPKQQPVDFGVWRAADGTWQLWSCIRNTREAGRTRLFYRWQGAQLTDADWKPMGVAMRADPKVGELAGGLQAPFVFRDRDRYLMFYGGWEHICSAAGKDGQTFERLLDEDGKATLFGEVGGNTRDPMLLRVGELWHCYYTAHPNDVGAVYCRTSRNLRKWSEATIVARGGQATSHKYAAECPFVVELEKGQYYLFRTQRYGKDAQTSVYCSRDPMDFGIEGDLDHFVCTLPLAAPEIIKHDGEYYIAALLPSLKGIQVARLRWAPQ